MFECIKFIFKIMTDFLKMLFTINIGNNMTLGMLMCIIFIFFPVVLSLVNFLKHTDGDIELSNLLKRKKGSDD